MYTLEDVYKTFPSGCTEDYKILRAFEMGKQSSDKKIRELEQQIEKMKCCNNCKYRCYMDWKSKCCFDMTEIRDIENPVTCKCEKWELAD